MDNINFSFVIPHKNSPQYLNDLVNTIPRREDIEIIIVDDNSDIACVNWKNFKFDNNKCIHLIETKEGKGAGFARNVGLKQAVGKWIIFPDSDDYYSDNLLDVIDSYVDSDYDVIYFKYVFENSHGKFIEMPYNKWIEDATLNDDNIDKIKYMENVPWNKMVRHQFIIDHDIHFEEVLNGNDIFFSYQVGFFSKNYCVDKNVLYYYVEHKKSITNKKRNSDEYYLCNLKHRVQCREFFKMIGHPKWAKSVLALFVSNLVKKGWQSFFQSIRVYLLNYNEVERNKFLYSDYFTNSIYK